MRPLINRLLSLARNRFLQRIFVFLFIKPLFKIFVWIFYLPCCLLPLSNERILFFNGTDGAFSCNPRYLFEKIYETFGDKYEYIWILKRPETVPVHYGKAIKVAKYMSPRFFYYLATSKIWVVNTHFLSEVRPRKSQVYLQTWHAAGAFKKFGIQTRAYDKSVIKMIAKDASHFTYLLCSAPICRKVYASAFGISIDKVKATGIPRNDILFNVSNTSKQKIKRKLEEEYGVDPTKKIILYAPTFRDFQMFSCFTPDIGYMKSKLGDKYVLLMRLHPVIPLANFRDMVDSAFTFDVKKYVDVQELLMVTDLLITDYSSIIFDYAILGRPMIFFPWDLDKYKKERAFYFDYEDFVPGPICFSTEELVEKILSVDKWFDRDKMLEFARKFNHPFDGRASERVIKLLGLK